MGFREQIYYRLDDGGRLTVDEALSLWNEAPPEELMYVADLARKRLHPGNRVGWIIDRNVNITNICFSQ